MSVVDPSSWNSADAAEVVTAEGAAEGLTVAAATLGAAADLTMVVAGLLAPAGLTPALAATTAVAATAPAAAATGIAPAAGLAVGILLTGLAAVGGRFGLTVMRAVSLGGALLTMVVPDFPPASGTGIGLAEAGLSGTPGGGGVTRVVAGVMIGAGGGTVGTTALRGDTGAGGAAGATGLKGLGGRTAAGAGLAPGRTGAGGITGLTGETPPGAGMTGGGGPALGVPDVIGGVGRLSMGCVLRGGTMSPCDEADVTEVGDFGTGAPAAGRIAVVVGETRGGGVTKLDFFLAVSASMASSASPAVAAAAAATATAGTTVEGLGGTVGAGVGFGASLIGMTAVLLAGGCGVT